MPIGCSCGLFGGSFSKLLRKYRGNCPVTSLRGTCAHPQNQLQIPPFRSRNWVARKGGRIRYDPHLVAARKAASVGARGGGFSASRAPHSWPECARGVPTSARSRVGRPRGPSTAMPFGATAMPFGGPSAPPIRQDRQEELAWSSRRHSLWTTFFSGCARSRWDAEGCAGARRDR